MPITITLNECNEAHLIRLHLMLSPNSNFNDFCSFFVNTICSQNLEYFSNAVEQRMYECKKCKIRYSSNEKTFFEYCPSCNSKLIKLYDHEDDVN